MVETEDPGPTRFLYTFQFPDGSQKKFQVTLNGNSLELLKEEGQHRPPWTKLKFQQCTNCPLGDEEEYCPVAVNYSSLVEYFKHCISFQRATVTVETEQRTYVKECDLQKGISSIIGIYNVTSNCPILDKLRPMVRFHLPFASWDETVYRYVSMYLIAQYFISREGGQPDWELKGLPDIFQAIATVNKGLSNRLRQATEEDASVNAEIILSTFNQAICFALEDGLKNLEHLFGNFLKHPD